VGLIKQILDLAQFGVDVGGNLPAFVDLNGVGESVGHGVSVVDLISLQGGWGHCCPLVDSAQAGTAARTFAFCTLRFALAALPHSLPLGWVPCTRRAKGPSSKQERSFTSTL